MEKFYGNTVSLSEDIAKSFRGPLFLTRTVYKRMHTYTISNLTVSQSTISFCHTSYSDSILERMHVI